MRIFQDLLKFAATNQKIIKKIFSVGFLLFGFFLAMSAWMIITDAPGVMTLYLIGPLLGQLSLLCFILTTSSGILRRFGVNHPLITISRLFARQTGLSSFFLALAHASILYLFPAIATGALPTILPAYIYGSIALSFMFGLALTSNDWSVQSMGKWWKRLHRLVYVIYWLIFLHVALNGSTWSYVIGTSAVLEVVSLLYDFMKSKRKVVTPVSSVTLPAGVNTPAVPSPESPSVE
jgi:DMSO/TMAO reductase YedYZ heme-binding membrane subunit